MVAAKVFDEIHTFLASKNSSDFIITLFINELKNMKIINHILNCGQRYVSEHDARSRMNNLSG